MFWAPAWTSVRIPLKTSICSTHDRLSKIVKAVGRVMGYILGQLYSVKSGLKILDNVWLLRRQNFIPVAISSRSLLVVNLGIVRTRQWSWWKADTIYAGSVCVEFTFNKKGLSRPMGSGSSSLTYPLPSMKGLVSRIFPNQREDLHTCAQFDPLVECMKGLRPISEHVLV